MKFTGKVQLLEDYMDDETYTCGPTVTDHDWSVENGSSAAMVNTDIAVLRSKDSNNTVYCNWCPATLSGGKIVMEKP